jgi:hypothetical protein
MDTTIRLLHILFGVFVGGTYLFMTPILEPVLKKLGPSVQGPVMQAIMPILTPAMATSFTGLMVTGFIMTAQERGLGSLFNSGWGADILIGIIATVVVMIVGFGILMPTGMKLEKAGHAAKEEGRPPTAEEDQIMGQLVGKIEKLTRINFTFVSIGIITMLVAPYL